MILTIIYERTCKTCVEWIREDDTFPHKPTAHLRLTSTNTSTNMAVSRLRVVISCFSSLWCSLMMHIAKTDCVTLRRCTVLPLRLFCISFQKRGMTCLLCCRFWQNIDRTPNKAWLPGMRYCTCSTRVCGVCGARPSHISREGVKIWWHSTLFNWNIVWI